MNNENIEKYISKAEAARVIGTTRQTMFNLVRRGHFTTKVVTGRVLLLRSEVEKYVARPMGRPPKREVAQKLPSKTNHKEDSKTEYFSQAEAARHRGVSDQAIAALIRRGRLTPVEVAGRIVVLRSEIEGFVARPKFGNPPPKKATSKKVSKKVKPKK
jgi:DNA-binding XRE family transcriptional regulator